jgi:hypothetical protein
VFIFLENLEGGKAELRGVLKQDVLSFWDSWPGTPDHLLRRFGEFPKNPPQNLKQVGDVHFS